MIPKYLPLPTDDTPLPANAPICELCGKQVFEVRPFGPNHESICEDCSKLDPEMTEKRYRGPGVDPVEVIPFTNDE